MEGGPTDTKRGGIVRCQVPDHGRRDPVGSQVASRTEREASRRGWMDDVCWMDDLLNGWCPAEEVVDVDDILLILRCCDGDSNDSDLNRIESGVDPPTDCTVTGVRTDSRTKSSWPGWCYSSSCLLTVYLLFPGCSHDPTTRSSVQVNPH
jgi:hypothetical protein